jgi:hypothetical protein
MAASPPKIWFLADTGISKCGRARAETSKALLLTGGGPFRNCSRKLAEAAAHS